MSINALTAKHWKADEIDLHNYKSNTMREWNMKDPCKKFSYIGSDGNPVYKDKVKYNTKAEAKQRAEEMNREYRVIHQLSVYLCPKCHKWHIGRSSVESVRREGYFNSI